MKEHEVIEYAGKDRRPNISGHCTYGIVGIGEYFRIDGARRALSISVGDKPKIYRYL